MERLTNFTEVRLAFTGVASAERSDERVSNIVEILSTDPSFIKLDAESRAGVLTRLRFLQKIQWKNPVQPLSHSVLKVGSEYLQDVLMLEEDPSVDLSPKGAFWTSDQKSELSTKLQIGHNKLMNNLRKSNPKLAIAADIIGTAAHWTARNAGATWSESVTASRYAEASLIPNSYQFKAHEMIVMNFIAARHGGIAK